MGKEKWRRVRLEDLASLSEQEKILKLLDQAKGQPAPDSDSPEKVSETATTGR